jgi:hypothetical protein
MEVIMGRIRTIKPEFPQSENMGRISRDARLLFILLWTVVDDEGRTRAASRMLASLLFPYDDDAPRLIEGWMAELAGVNCIRQYVIDGSHYLEIQNWLKHQKIDHPTSSKLPAFSREFAMASRKLAPDLDLDLDLGPIGAKAPLSEKASDPCAKKSKPVYSEAFEKFWKAYPTDKLMSKSEASKVWQKLTPEDQSAAVAGLPGFSAYCRANPDYRPVHACRYLSQRRFDGYAPKAPPTSVAPEGRPTSEELRRKYANVMENGRGEVPPVDESGTRARAPNTGLGGDQTRIGGIRGLGTVLCGSGMGTESVPIAGAGEVMHDADAVAGMASGELGAAGKAKVKDGVVIPQQTRKQAAADGSTALESISQMQRREADEALAEAKRRKLNGGHEPAPAAARSA